MNAELDRIELCGGPLCGAIVEIELDPDGDGSFSQEFLKGIAWYKDRGNNYADFVEWLPNKK